MRKAASLLAFLAVTSLHGQNLLPNPHYDSNLNGWILTDTTFDSTRDGNGSPFSGSARTAAMWFMGTQTCSYGAYPACVPAKPDTSYRGSAKVLIEAGQQGLGLATTVILFYSDQACQNFISPPYLGNVLSYLDAGFWKTSLLTVFSPSNTQSAQAAVNICTQNPNPFIVNTDDLQLQQSTTLPPGDFNNDGNSDVLWRNDATGADAMWFMLGAGILSTSSLPTVADPNFHIAGTGDFQGDGIADVVWRNNVTGATVIWLMNGATVAASSVSTVPSPWDIAALGDLNGDGNADIIWRNSATGDNVVWFMAGLSPVTTATLPSIPDTNWKIGAVGDFQGDGRMDLIWRNSVTGDDAVWLMNGAAVAVSASLPNVPTAWQIVGAGDFQADGKTDLLWRNESTGDNVIWFMNGTSIGVTAPLPNVPSPWTVARVADFQNDGKADIVWRNTSSGANSIWLMNGASIALSGPLTAVPDTNWNIAHH